MKKILLVLLLFTAIGHLSFLVSCENETTQIDYALYAGGAFRNFSYLDFETWNDLDGNGLYDSGDEFNDWGEDRIASSSETGYDTVSNPDPNRDDFDAVVNFTGSEGNGVFEYLTIAGSKRCADTYPVGCRLAQDVSRDLSVRAATFRWRSEIVMFVVFDLLAIPHVYINPLKREIAQATGVTYERIVVVTTGNRQGPDVSGFWSGEIMSKWLMETIMPLALEVAIESVGSLQKVRLVTAETELAACIERIGGTLKVSDGCRFPLYDDLEYTRADVESVYDIPLLIKDERDPIVIDNSLLAVQARSESTDEAVVTLINYSAIPDAMGKYNNVIGPDYPGYLIESVESSAGGVALFLPRTAGGTMSSSEVLVPYRDAEGNPSAGHGLVREAFGGTLEAVDADEADVAFPLAAPGQDMIFEASEAKARSLGYYLAEQALVALNRAEYVSPVTMAVLVEDHDVIFTHPIFIDYQRSLLSDINFDPLDSYHSLSYCLEEEFGCLRTLVQVVFLGDLQIVAFPGELPAEYILGREVISAPYSTYTNSEAPCLYGANYFPDVKYKKIESLKALVYQPTAESAPYKIMPVGNANTRIGVMLPERDLQSEFCHPNYNEEPNVPSYAWADSVLTHIGKMMNATFRFSNAPYYPWESSIFTEGYSQEPY
jgi:hypothetical protein